jgi:hypothetical protein
MRTFIGEVEVKGHEGELFRLVTVKACTIKGALKRIQRKVKKQKDLNGFIYQVCTRVKECELDQPVWDYLNGNMSAYFGLDL